MKIAVINTGTELLNGSTVNTNSARIGEELAACGHTIALGITAGDTPSALYEALGAALRAADCVIISGGLGSTRDDITLESTARFFGWELTESPELRKHVENFWYQRHAAGGRIPPVILRQALMPAGAVILPNPNGSASGYMVDCRYDRRDRRIILLPGPPRELVPMLKNELLCRLQPTGSEHFSCGFLAAGCGELFLQKLLEKPMNARGAGIGYCARPEGTRVFVTAQTRADADAAAAEARALVGTPALAAGEIELLPVLLRLLAERGLTLGCAESCTGGMIAAAVTDYPGVSAFFKGGAVVYSNELKMKLLGVPAEILEKYGAVSTECAGAMVRGALEALNCTAAVAVTGIAGPEGGSDEKPVGLVCIAAAVNDRTLVREYRFHGDRHAIRERTCANAFLLLRELLLAD